MENCLFGAVSLTKMLILISINILGIALNLIEKVGFSFGNVFGRNCIILGTDMSSSSHANNKKKIFVLGKDFVQGINSTTIYAEKWYKINFTEKN